MLIITLWQRSLKELRVQHPGMLTVAANARPAHSPPPPPSWRHQGPAPRLWVQQPGLILVSPRALQLIRGGQTQFGSAPAKQVCSEDMIGSHFKLAASCRKACKLRLAPRHDRNKVPSPC